MIALLILATAFFAYGYVLWSRKRKTIAQAMERDGFKPHEVRKALRLYDRNKKAELASYCHAVVERKAKPDWTKADSYRELV